MQKDEQMQSYLDETSKILSSWLEKELPDLSQDNWWKYNVIAKLSYAQGDLVNRKGIKELSKLDLAALLRILDKNWDELVYRGKINKYEGRHFLKEMQDVRNRRAHKPAAGYEQDQIFRDFDTIERFLELIGANEDLVSQIYEAKMSIFSPEQEKSQKPAEKVKDAVHSSKDEKPENVLSRAVNLSIRVPWHDSGWEGHVCSNPQKNISCLHLKNIAENKDVEFECSLMGKKIKDLSQEDKENLVCLKENAAFLSKDKYTFDAKYPYDKYSGLDHILPTPVNTHPNTLISRPFRWFRTKDTPASKIVTGYCISRENDYKASHTNSSGYPINETWINEPINQKAIIEYYYDGVSEKSLLVPYLKNVPFTDDGRRIVLGIGYAEKVHENQIYNSSDDSITDMPTVWDKVIEHNIVKDGFLLPYKELYEQWLKGSLSDIENYILYVDDEYRVEFSNGSEHVSYDALLSILKNAKNIFLDISRDIHTMGTDYARISSWIDAQTKKLKKERGIFPALGNLLLASDNFIINVEGEEKNIALDIIKSISYDGSSKSIESINRNIDNEERLTQKQKSSSKLFISKNLDLINNLSRFTLNEEQFKVILNEKIEYLPENPYLLFENSITMKEELRIPISKIDNGIFFEDKTQESIQKTTPGLVLLKNDSKERLRAFIIRELDEQALKNGHSLLPLDYLIELINKRNLLHDLNFKKGDLDLPDYREYIEEKIIIKKSEGEFYLKLKSIDENDVISKKEIDVRLKAEKISIDTSVFKDELKTLPDDEEEIKKAKKEQLDALEQLAVNKISVLIGAAGTGKTHVISYLCEHEDISTNVLLLAPTGKARVRMWDATGKKYTAKTIAGYLIADKCFDWNTGRYTVPENSKVELAGANVIIDESSMLTTDMFAAILKTCSQAKRIVFVGDPNQLPPIGCGKPFSDLVDYLQQGYPDNVARLSHIWRNEVIEANSFAAWFKNDSNTDESIFDKVESNADAHSGIRFTKYEDNLQEVLLDEIVKITGMESQNDINGFDVSLGAIINGQYTNFNTGGIRAFNIPIDQGAGSKAENWQILSPVKNSPDGTYGINDLIHNKYRPTTFTEWGRERNKYHSSEVKGLQKIGVGDKVICTENGNSDPFPLNDFKYIANGEIGIRVSPARGTDFPNVEFSTQLNVSYWGKKYKGRMYPWKYKGDENDGDLELAYAITIHKAQGSQFEDVILVLNKNSGMLSRELIYTAITRQKKGLVILYNDDIHNLLKYSSDLYSDLAKRCTDLFSPPKFVRLTEGWYEEAKIHRTTRGDMVRSKSEVIIANLLTTEKLDWHYENDGQFIEIEDRKLLPDFVIIEKGKTYYWEHLGLLNNPRYKRDWEEKKKLYSSKKDIILIESKDGPNGEIDSKDVLEKIKLIQGN